MSSVNKVLFLGMDAGNKFLIQELAADGILPTFRSLLNRGLVGDTMSLEGFYEGSTWPSFYTGVTPAQHGIHSLIQLTPGTYKFEHIRPGYFVKCDPFWNHLSRAGKRVAVFDIPLSGISQELNGIQMIEWGCHDGVYGFHTRPEHLKHDVLERFGPHPLIRSCDSFGWTQKEFPAFRNLLVQGARLKGELTKHYLKQGSWDFFGQVFSEGHCAGHQCWHLHDQRQIASITQSASVTEDPMLDVYIAIDTAIGEILAHIDPETIVIFLAGHRMAHYFGLQFLLPDVLCRLKVARTPMEVTTEKPPDTMDRLEAVLTWGWRHTPRSIRERLQSLRRNLRGWIDVHQGRPSPMFFGIEPRKSKCFLLHNGASVCGIRLNLAGREPEGLLQPGEEAEVFCDQLVQDLMDIVDLDTGKPAVKSVKRCSELYQGKYLDHLPDLLVEWNDEKRVGNTVTGTLNGARVRLFSDKIGVVEGMNTYCRSGDHRPEGLFIAFGPGIKPGRMKRTVSIMDFAPTFADLLGVKLPLSDGTPITEILKAR